MPRRASAGRAKNGISPHRDTSLGMLGFVTRVQADGRLRCALPMAEELNADVKFASRLSFGPPSARMLGRIYFDLGRYAEAASLMKTSALTERSSWRPVQRAMQFVDFAYAGDAYRRLGRFAESRQFLEMGLARKSNRGDPAEAACAAVRAELGYTAMAEGNLAEAERLFREALQEYDTVPPINQWNNVRPRGRISSGLGQALAGQGKLAEAEPLLVAGFSELVAQRHTLWGDPSWLLREMLEAVVQFYRAAGKPEKAAEWELKKADL
jgi:tetratricopeptide (TPR) repeat protein